MEKTNTTPAQEPANTNDPVVTPVAKTALDADEMVHDEEIQATEPGVIADKPIDPDEAVHDQPDIVSPEATAVLDVDDIIHKKDDGSGM